MYTQSKWQLYINQNSIQSSSSSESSFFFYNKKKQLISIMEQEQHSSPHSAGTRDVSSHSSSDYHKKIKPSNSIWNKYSICCISCFCSSVSIKEQKSHHHFCLSKYNSNATQICFFSSASATTFYSLDL